MEKDSSISFELCVLCKTSRMLCGRSTCPLVQKWFSSLDESFSPPSFFVGRVGYPVINTGPMLTVERIGSNMIDNPNNWARKTQEEVVQMRVALLRTRSKIDIKRPLDSDIIQKSHELLLGKKAVDVEVELEKKIIPKIILDERVAPHGPIVPIKKLNIVENQSPINAIEKSYYDTDLLASEAVSYLGKEKIDETTITRVFSAGMLGRGKNRKLVPTRWSITAIDDMLSKNNIEKIKKFQELGEIQIFSNVFFGNHFVIILIPDVWSYEMIEVWFKGAYMNPSLKDIGLQDWERYKGRTEYASNITGAYYAARLAISEYLLRIQRQAQAIVLREITNEYRFPLGVWVIRIGTREAFKKKPIVVQDIDSAFALLNKYFRYPVKYWMKKSKLYNFNKTQKKLLEFL
ncbi:MAG: Nre family DNA repair protein [Candidatus Heimdallarchaeaceae archaeon]